MKPSKYLIVLFLFIIQISINAQRSVDVNPIDVKHYLFELTVNDSTNVIEGTATISLKIKKIEKEFYLDLSSLDKSNKGMHVVQITNKNKQVSFQHKNDQIKIQIPSGILNDSLQVYKIEYQGIPIDGLIISNNKYGDRTFFGDNWPTRARNWLPCNDEISDKALLDFIVKVPEHYQVISNGTLTEESNLNNHLKLYHYSCDIPLSTYLMVVGISRFSVQNLESLKQIPISTWVYPQNKEEGFYDYKQAVEIVDYFTDQIASFPFSKLANVQSKTRFGGMENAGAIFYSENSVTGKRKDETLLAHEIAHQWFGDSATEKEWSHLWLSEGFATYFTNLYLEHKYGKSKLEERLINERKKIIRFYEKQQTPVVDTDQKNYMRLLNANSYEKGGWFLHMLRRKIGDEQFWKSIKTYYQKYKYDNALTEDFKKITEEVSNQDLSLFFEQWLYGVGQPEIDLQWKNQKGQVEIIVEQIQKSKANFEFPLELLIKLKDGTTRTKIFFMDQKSQKFVLPVQSQVTEIVLDPNVSLLYKSSALH